MVAGRKISLEQSDDKIQRFVVSCSRFLFDFHTDLSKDIIGIAFYVITFVVNKSVRQDTCPLFEVHSRFFRA